MKQDSVSDSVTGTGGELAVAIADQDPEPPGSFAEIHQEVAGLPTMYALAAPLLLWETSPAPSRRTDRRALGILPMGMLHAAIGAFGKKPADGG